MKPKSLKVDPIRIGSEDDVSDPGISPEVLDAISEAIEEIATENPERVEEISNQEGVERLPKTDN